AEQIRRAGIAARPVGAGNLRGQIGADPREDSEPYDRADGRHQDADDDRVASYPGYPRPASLPAPRQRIRSRWRPAWRFPAWRFPAGAAHGGFEADFVHRGHDITVFPVPHSLPSAAASGNRRSVSARAASRFVIREDIQHEDIQHIELKLLGDHAWQSASPWASCR